MTQGYAGMLDGSDHNFASGFSEEASAEIPFGVAVARGTADDGVKLPAASTAKIRGVVVHSHAYDKDQELGDTGIKPKCQISVGRRGRFLVTVEEAVIPGDRAFIRYATGDGGSQKGAWRKSAVAGETIDVTAEAEFQTTASAAGLAVVEVDFTNS
jgi:hypothetical protein